MLTSHDDVPCGPLAAGGDAFTKYETKSLGGLFQRNDSAPLAAMTCRSPICARWI